MVFYWASKSGISVEKGVIFSSKIREKGVFFKLGYERGIRFDREWGGRGSLQIGRHRHTSTNLQLHVNLIRELAKCSETPPTHVTHTHTHIKLLTNSVQTIPVKFTANGVRIMMVEELLIVTAMFVPDCDARAGRSVPLLNVQNVAGQLATDVEPFSARHFGAVDEGLGRKKVCHYSDVISASWRLRSPTRRLFVQQFDFDNQENIKGSHWNPPVTGGFPSKVSVNAESVSLPWPLHVHTCLNSHEVTNLTLYVLTTTSHRSLTPVQFLIIISPILVQGPVIRSWCSPCLYSTAPLNFTQYIEGTLVSKLSGNIWQMLDIWVSFDFSAEYVRRCKCTLVISNACFYVVVFFFIVN